MQRHRRTRRDSGFSLIELLIVVAIILVIAAIAIPNLLRSRISANEASAAASVRQIITAQGTYLSTYPHIGYADTITKLGNPGNVTPLTENNAGILDWVLGCASQPCPKSGYLFQVTGPVGTPVFSFEIEATPLIIGKTGNRGFCGDVDGVIRYDPAGGTDCGFPLH